jgi:hypothetical protein
MGKGANLESKGKPTIICYSHFLKGDSREQANLIPKSFQLICVNSDTLLWSHNDRNRAGSHHH